ncbi:MAG: DUF2279 domain-containing protein [Flavisolibacter sp.]
MKKSFLNILIFFSLNALAQDSSGFSVDSSGKPYDPALLEKSPDRGELLMIAPVNKKNPPNYKTRKWLAGTATVVGYGGSFILLNEAWYKDYPRSSFHTYNDAGEWMQMDKIGHGWTAYTLSRVSTNMWKWAGVENKKAVWIGSGTGLLYLLSIEYLDGLSAEWGWSWADVAADVFGTGLFAAQELLWKEQRINLKYSAHIETYEPASLEERADYLFGNTKPERMLKDYNQQTYWLSFNLKSLLKLNKFPPWLNIAFGHGAEGMFGGYENVDYDEDGNITFDRRDIKRYRQWYLSPDIDLTKIKTKSGFLRSVFSAVNILKFPAPALELSNGKLHFRAIVF